MNKLIAYSIILPAMAIIMQSCFPDNNTEIPTTEEKGVIAFEYSPFLPPLKTDSGYIFINNDFNLIEISNKGYHYILNDYSSFFTDAQQIINDGGSVQFQKSKLPDDYLIYTISKNALSPDYSQVNILKINQLGTINAFFTVNIQAVDSINSIDTIYNRDFVELNVMSDKIWIAFSLSIDKMPQKKRYLEFLVYNFSDSLLLDTILATNSNQKPLKIIQNNQSLVFLNTEFSPQGPKLVMRTIDGNYNLTDSAFISIPATEIYYTNFLPNNNYFFAGIENQEFSDATSQKNFVAEISPTGELLLYKNNFNYNYLFFYDVVKVDDGYLSCGLYSINQSFPSWTAIKELTGTAYFLGYFNNTTDSLIMANTTAYGTSLSTGLHKTENGYTLLNYMSFIDNPLSETYLWLYKLNKDFKIE